MKAELLQTTSGGQVVIATITLENDRISVSSDNLNIEASLLDTPANIEGERVYAKDDARAWFRALPRTFSGDYLRARIVSS